MPRTKVHPSNRQRAAEACNHCKASKKKCTSTFPCLHCIRRGRPESCIQVKQKPPPAPDNSAGSALHGLLSTVSSRDTLHLPPPAFSPTPQVGENDNSAEFSQPQEARHRTHSRMLRNSHEEKGRYNCSSEKNCSLISF
jgi:hypothetical protein